MRLGAPGPTVLDVLLQLQVEKAKAKKNITTIEEWVLVFNNFISVVAMHSTEPRVHNRKREESIVLAYHPCAKFSGGQVGANMYESACG